METISSSNIAMDKTLIGFDRFFYDAAERNLHNGYDVILLEPRVGEVLEYLLRSQTAVERNKLIDEVWGLTGSDEALTQAISRLRRALNDTLRPYKIIKTIPRAGYKIGVDTRFVDHLPSNQQKDDKNPTDWIGIFTRHRSFLLGVMTGLLIAFFGFSLWFISHPPILETKEVICYQGSTDILCQE